MMTPNDDLDRASDELDRIVAGYIDRLTAGETVLPADILSEHPVVGGEVLDQLEAFISLGTSPASGSLEEVGVVPVRVLGDYELRQQIGRGGMGVVYDAWQHSMDRRVALKVLPPALAADRRNAARFLREAQSAGQLDHPNVVHVHGLGIEENTPYYAMLTGQSRHTSFRS